ncbi:MAG TPA: AfsR/SARP family transcriptional regulator [Solirubrobacteraceae bacterium]|nr:AfsR/SARP family transcriptional regulator [Solirubrobacteraceae bacterium]
MLGPLEVLERDRVVALGGGQQRALLAMLLLHANEVVSGDRLIDALWGDDPPVNAAKTVQVYVSRLRKEIGEGRIATRAPGYMLQVDRSELDLAQFEQLVGEAQRSDPGRAAQTLRRALALWRGPALADLAYESFAQPEVARLEELRWAALEHRIDADLATGRHAELVGELGGLIAEHPLRERLRAQLMLALYRSGRQAEALSAYRQAQRELSDELGLEPSEELKRLEQAILRQDPVLEPARAAPAVPTPSPGRSLLLAPGALAGLDALVRLATPLAAAEPPRELVVAAIVDGSDLASATATLAKRREELLAAGVAARAAAFSSRARGRDIVRLAGQESVDLVLSEIAQPRLDDDTTAVLGQAPCDVALLVGMPREGPVLVPFGGAWHDWAALELGAWVARASGARLRLIGALGADDEPDASRLLADASLIVQRTAGIVAEPLLAPPGSGVLALAEGAGLLVVGFSERWRQEGLGRVRGALVEAPPAPTALVRRGPRPGGLAPPETVTRYGWSLTS